MDLQGPTTAREISFAQVYGRELREAREASRRYLRFGDPSELDKAWDIYYALFKKIEKQMPQLVTLDLQYVSPELLKARDLELAVPGEPLVRRSCLIDLNFRLRHIPGGRKEHSAHCTFRDQVTRHLLETATSPTLGEG